PVPDAWATLGGASSLLRHNGKIAACCYVGDVQGARCHSGHGAMDAANQAIPLPGVDCQSLAELLARRAADSPAAVAFSCGQQSISYARLDALSSALAQWLAGEPAFAPGTRIALQLP